MNDNKTVDFIVNQFLIKISLVGQTDSIIEKMKPLFKQNLMDDKWLIRIQYWIFGCYIGDDNDDLNGGVVELIIPSLINSINIMSFCS